MAKDRKEEVEEPEQEVAPKKKSNIKWIIIGAVIFLLIASLTIAGFFFFKQTAAHKAPVEKPAVLTIWPMDAFIINLAESNGERYLKLVVQLEVSDQSVTPELEQFKPRLRDSILDLLTQKTYKELMDLSGKQRLREDIAGRVNNMLTKGKVTKVYFTDFVVQ
jgi:flagellar FliL protein